MSEHITDEEMAEWEPLHVPKPEMRILCVQCNHTLPCPTLRFIAALRESRAEVTRLQRIVDGWGKLEFSSRWAGPA